MNKNILLNNCKCSKDIICTLKNYHCDPYIYIEAMRLCHNFNTKDPRSVHKIFVLFLESESQATLSHFNTFFNCIIDSPLLCSRYFNQMTKKCNLTPDIVTLTCKFEYIECIAAKNEIQNGNFDSVPEKLGSLDVLAQHINGVACSTNFKPDELYKNVKKLGHIEI